MSAFRPLETRLPDVLEELSAPRTPAYVDDILGQVARTRQRPGWTFIERWLPMTTVTDRLATVPRAPIRLAVAVALLIALLVAGVAVYVGSQRPSLPAPFGVAGNGEVAFTDGDGAIHLGNPADGTSMRGAGRVRPPTAGRSLLMACGWHPSRSRTSSTLRTSSSPMPAARIRSS